MELTALGGGKLSSRLCVVCGNEGRGLPFLSLADLTISSCSKMGSGLKKRLQAETLETKQVGSKRMGAEKRGGGGVFKQCFSICGSSPKSRLQGCMKGFLKVEQQA